MTLYSGTFSLTGRLTDSLGDIIDVTATPSFSTRLTLQGFYGYSAVSDTAGVETLVIHHRDGTTTTGTLDLAETGYHSFAGFPGGVTNILGMTDPTTGVAVTEADTLSTDGGLLTLDSRASYSNSRLALPDGSVVTVNGSLTATGTLDAVPVLYSFSTPSLSATETAGATHPLQFVVQRTGDTAEAGAVGWSLAGIGPNPADTGGTGDFLGLPFPQTLSFAPGVTTQTIDITLSRTIAYEPDETFALTLHSVPEPQLLHGGEVSTIAATGTIINDNPDFAIAPLSADQPEGNGTLSPATFVISRVGPPTNAPATVHWWVDLAGTHPIVGSATVDAQDFVGGVTWGSVWFAADQATATIDINVKPDLTPEPDERYVVIVDGGNPTHLWTTGVIRNDDAPVATLSITPSAQSMAEGNSAATNNAFTFTVTRTGAIHQALSVQWEVTGSGANPAGGQDFANPVGAAGVPLGHLPRGTLSFAADQLSQTITLPIVGDGTIEANEGFTVSVYSAAGTVSATGTILDDDAASGLVRIDAKTNLVLPVAPTLYTGPVAGLQNQFIDTDSTNMVISAATPGWFIHTGSGDDAVAVNGGTNVIDGGTGSNFLTGGSGPDSFFLDARGATSAIWSTVNGFGAGDSITIWGLNNTHWQMIWSALGGAPGYGGPTLNANLLSGGAGTVSLTLAGFSSSANLNEVFGHDAASGSDYLYITPK